MLGLNAINAPVRRVAALFMIGMVLASCQTVPRNPFTLETLNSASPTYRYDLSVQDAQRRLVGDIQHSTPPNRSGAVLAISGGGANGAFGAGVLYGWGARGDRPSFDVITGVSVGSLIAPFVFAGRDFDEDLKAAFTDGRSEHLVRSRGLGALLKPGILHSAPLRRLVYGSVSPELVAAVAREHRSGRRLLVATVSLDTQRQVVWDLGALAARGDPASLRLFNDILVAACSIPGAFAPALLPVSNNGRSAVLEMHVDGGTISNFFLMPQDFPVDRSAPRYIDRMYVVLNSSAEPQFQVVGYGGLKIAARSFDTMQKALAGKELKYIQSITDHGVADVRVAEIPQDASAGFLDFSTAHMRALFEVGSEIGGRSAAFVPFGRSEALTPTPNQ